MNGIQISWSQGGQVREASLFTVLYNFKKYLSSMLWIPPNNASKSSPYKGDPDWQFQNIPSLFLRILKLNLQKWITPVIYKKNKCSSCITMCVHAQRLEPSTPSICSASPTCSSIYINKVSHDDINYSCNPGAYKLTIKINRTI